MTVDDGAGAESITPGEWRAYLGPNADYYLERFARFRQSDGVRFRPTWNWASFITSPWWFLYRKMYVYFLVTLLGSLVPFGWLVAGLASGLAANYFLHDQASRRILALKVASPGREIEDRRRRRGGVHAWVPWLAVPVTAALIAAALWIAS